MQSNIKHSAAGLRTFWTHSRDSAGSVRHNAGTLSLFSPIAMKALRPSASQSWWIKFMQAFGRLRMSCNPCVINLVIVDSSCTVFNTEVHTAVLLFEYDLLLSPIKIDG